MTSKEESAAYMREWRRKNPARAYQHVKNAESKRPEYYKKLHKLAHLRRKYGLTETAYEELKAVTRGLCSICLKPGQVVDHSHASNKIRGWLCDLCNKGLGLFHDDPTALRRAAEYVEQHQE